VTCDGAILNEWSWLWLEPAGQVSNSLGGTNNHVSPSVQTGGLTCALSEGGGAPAAVVVVSSQNDAGPALNAAKVLVPPDRGAADLMTT